MSRPQYEAYLNAMKNTSESENSENTEECKKGNMNLSRTEKGESEETLETKEPEDCTENNGNIWCTIGHKKTSKNWLANAIQTIRRNYKSDFASNIAKVKELLEMEADPLSIELKIQDNDLENKSFKKKSILTQILSR